jgi:hypothetical protein
MSPVEPVQAGEQQTALNKITKKAFRLFSCLLLKFSGIFLTNTTIKLYVQDIPTYLSYKDYAYLDKNAVPPAHGIPLIFASKASLQYALNALNINSGSVRDTNNIILWPLYTGASSWNTVWYITPEGYIVCPSFPWIVLGIVNGILCVVARNSSDATQLWSLTGYGDGYTITNTNSQQVITAATQSVYENGAQQAGSISMESLNGGSPDASQLWIPLPAGNIPQSRFYIQTKMSGLPGTGGFLLPGFQRAQRDYRYAGLYAVCYTHRAI